MMNLITTRGTTGDLRQRRLRVARLAGVLATALATGCAPFPEPRVQLEAAKPSSTVSALPAADGRTAAPGRRRRRRRRPTA